MGRETNQSRNGGSLYLILVLVFLRFCSPFSLSNRAATLARATSSYLQKLHSHSIWSIPLKILAIQQVHFYEHCSPKTGTQWVQTRQQLCSGLPTTENNQTSAGSPPHGKVAFLPICSRPHVERFLLRFISSPILRTQQTL